MATEKKRYKKKDDINGKQNENRRNVIVTEDGRLSFGFQASLPRSRLSKGTGIGEGKSKKIGRKMAE